MSRIQFCNLLAFSVAVIYNKYARSRIPCRRAQKFILKRGKLN